MPLEQIGINFSAIENVSFPTFDLKNTSQELINDIPIKANEVTGGLYGLMSLSILFVFLMWKLNQSQTEAGDYSYGTMRSTGISAGVCSIIGLYALNIGYFVNFFHVVIFIMITFISVAFVYKSSN